MKISRRFLRASVIFLLLSINVVIPQTSHASSKDIISIVDLPHRNIGGDFIDDELSTSLLPTGTLGSLVFSPPSKPRTWLIDASLLDDVLAMPLENVAAKNWLAQLKYVTSNDDVFALAYGHPNLALAKRLAPTELSYYFSTSKERLQSFLGREISVDKKLSGSKLVETIQADRVLAYTLNRRAIALLATVIPASELYGVRLRLSTLLAPGYSKESAVKLATDADEAINRQKHKLRVVVGKYRLTSEKEKLPITLVNDFNTSVLVNLQIIPKNSRVQIAGVRDIILEPSSKKQLSIPITSIATGPTTLFAQLTNSKAVGIGESAILSLNVSVISPAVAWFTTGAAILLFLGALIQSVRRIRRSRK
ncbi:unannotated protein [freshwater metagenome]|uniref:Unannotated protein n=1 Tax=freshwater metagenome TaxID=449393 RepID=A0A6J7LKU5_9ZZZZ|nr:hypothetical protein [Actinomycetota bacterium]MSY20198.1 hypothetical protein [Actinomycetota bacterium]